MLSGDPDIQFVAVFSFSIMNELSKVIFDLEVIHEHQGRMELRDRPDPVFTNRLLAVPRA